MPHVQIVRAVMNAGEFAELMRVEHKAGVAMRSKPDSAILILKLRSKRMRRMSAKIKNRRRWFGGSFRNVKIAGDVEPRQTLKDKFLDAIGLEFESARNLGLERRPLRQRIQAKHVEQLAAQLWSLFFPIVQRADVVQAACRHLGREALQLIGRHFVALRGAVLRME